MVNIDRIKELAKEKGIKIKFICSQLGLAETYLSNVKNGKDRMTDERLQKIADILDTTVEYLTGESDEKEKTPEPLDPDHNVLIMRGRDGSYIRKQLTDEEVRALAVLVSQMKDAPDDI